MPKVALKSFAAFPTQNRIYFCFNDTVYDPTCSAAPPETNTSGTVVIGHPNQIRLQLPRPQSSGQRPS